MWLDFRLDTPKSLVRRAKTDPVVEKTWVDSKPDLDNLEKAVLDAGNALWWVDDAVIVFVCKSKRYAAPWDEWGPGVLIAAAKVTQTTLS